MTLRTSPKPETDEKPLTRVRRGYWRARWEAARPDADTPTANGVTRLPDGTYLGWRRFPTREMAEQKTDNLTGVCGGGWQFVEFVFFPENEDPQ